MTSLNDSEDHSLFEKDGGGQESQEETENMEMMEMPKIINVTSKKR